MSTTPFASSDPSPTAVPDPTAPSALVASGATLARAIGFGGLFLAVLGVVVVVTTRAVGPRWVSEGWGFLFGGVGLALMLYHAAVDGEQEVRRMYGGLAVLLLVIATAVGVLPGPFDGSSKSAGYFLLPWGVFAGLLGLLFAIPFVRHETNDFYRGMALNALLGVGAVLTVGAVVAGLAKPDMLAGSAAAVALLGIGFVCAYLAQADTESGVGHTVAVAVGVLGGLLVAYVLARTVFPTVLYDGPKDLRKPNGVLDKWAVGGRLLVILACLGYASVGFRKGQSALSRVAFVGPGLIGAAVFALATFNAPVKALPQPFLVPAGLILGLLGTILLAVSVGTCSDHPFVVMVRRELATYFLSPIGYLVLAGMTLCQWLQYLFFWAQLKRAAASGRPLDEPIVQDYLLALLPILCVLLPIPALTMRLLSEEKRSGSLEVLLTSPVNEGPVVLSKFLATWFFFLLCWLPSGLFLFGIRAVAETGFDYRPMLSFYASLAVCAAAFVAWGLFFSALTSNQIVAAVLTFMLLMVLVSCYWLKRFVGDIGPTAQAFLGRLSFIDQWSASLEGQLPVRDILVWASAAVLGLFLSVKVLETRKWN